MTVLIFLASLSLLLGIGECLNSTAYVAGNHDVLLHKRQTRSISYDNALNKEILAWTCPMRQSFGYLNEFQKWYVFLNSLFCVLSTYEIQVNKSNYDVYNIENWGKSNDASTDGFYSFSRRKNTDDGKQGIKIDRNNLGIFLEKIEQYNIAYYDSIKTAAFTELQLEELNHVLNLTIKQGLQISCEGNHIFIKGHYVIVSQITPTILSEKIDKNCVGTLHTKETFFNIFALNTLFIDADIPTFHIGQPMTIIAPKWQIIGSRKINFNGESAEPYPSPYYENGRHGKPGKPGSPGGNFFGIGYEYVNGANLIISANGGNGGPGQEGENGRKGNDGTTPTVPVHVGCRAGLCDNNNKINLFRCEFIKYSYQWTSPAITGAPSMPTKTGCSYKMFGENGREGGNGGNGGKGGAGGIQGSIELFELNGYSGISRMSKSGQKGTDGPGGAGGLGGKRGRDIIVKCNFHNNEWSLDSTLDSYGIPKSGANGLQGANSRNMEMPKAPMEMDNLTKSKIINQYKSYLRENLSDRFTYYNLINFLKLLENNYNVKSVYNTLGFIDELQCLEKHFHTLNEDINLLPFYQSLLSRISEYAKNPAEDVNPDLYKKVLGYLYTVTLGKIYNLEDNLESNLIIDITAYLDSVENDIHKLNHFQNSKTKEEVINKYKQEYKNKIDTKIKEAIDVISKDITPEIDSIGADIDAQMESLISDITDLKHKTRIEHETLTAKQHELEKVLVFQNVISSVKIFGQVISFLGPVGAAVSTVIGVSGTVAETFIFNTPGNLNSTKPLIDSVNDLQTLKGQIKHIRDQKVANMKTALDIASEEANKYPDTLADVSVKISDFRSRLDKVSGNKATFQEVQDLEIEIKTTIQRQTKPLLDARENSNDQRTKNEFVAIQNVQKAIQLSSVVLDAFNKHKFNQAKLEAINDAIKKNENNFYKLKKFEDDFYSTIIPMLQKIQNDIDRLISSLDRKSKVALDVAKWKIKGTLEDMILQIKELTKEFKVQGNIARCIQKVKEAIVTLITVHDHIRDFEKDQNFADLIADINSITVSNIVYNPKLENDYRYALRDLEIDLRSSIVVQRHKVAIDAFKQFVFPFADYYFRGLISPSHLKLNSDAKDITLENLILRAVIEIEHLKSKLEEYKATVRKHDRCIGTGIFKSDYISSKPFFVWSNEEHKNMISKLLSGEAVLVKADIEVSAPDKDSIKFNIIAFNFTSKDKTKQSEIDRVLKGFQINATHLGDSYYRYDKKFYLMTTPSQNIWYTFEKRYNGEPVYKSSTYEKIRKGDFMLSPYSSWKLKLDKVTDHASFENLKRYRDEIDLELGGYGYYVNNRNGYCSNLHIEKYYKSVNMYEDSRSQWSPHLLRDDAEEGLLIPLDEDENEEDIIPFPESENTHNVGNPRFQSHSPSLRDEGLLDLPEFVFPTGTSIPIDQDTNEEDVIPLYESQNGFNKEHDEAQNNEGNMDNRDYDIGLDDTISLDEFYF